MVYKSEQHIKTLKRSNHYEKQKKTRKIAAALTASIILTSCGDSSESSTAPASSAADSSKAADSSSAAQDKDENAEIIAAVQANADLKATWDDVKNDSRNEDDVDYISDLLERLGISSTIGNDTQTPNEYEKDDKKLTHEEVLEIIKGAHPDGCIKNPFDTTQEQ